MRKRDGRAEAGVSMFIELLLLFWLGRGRAKGFGGPVAPAESIAEADGDGGGRTIPEPVCELMCREGCDVASVVAVTVFRGDADSAVALPASDSSGICTLRRGRETLPTRRLLDRDGGVKVSGIDDSDPFLLICGCPCVFARWRDGGEFVLPISSECDRLEDDSVFTSGWNAAKCCESMDRFSSIGVKMLPPFRGGCFLMAVSRSRG